MLVQSSCSTFLTTLQCLQLSSSLHTYRYPLTVSAYPLLSLMVTRDAATRAINLCHTFFKLTGETS